MSLPYQSASAPACGRSSRARASWLAVAWLLGGAPATPAAPAADPGLITSIQQFWDIPADQRDVPHRFEFECTVTFYDSDWKLLWVQDDTSGAYVPTGSASLPIRSGQRIRASGTLHPPLQDISFADATLTVLAETSSLTPLPVDQLEPPTRWANRLVTVEGLVDRQDQTDPGHAHVFVSTGSRMVYARVLTPPDQPLPTLVDTFIRIHAVYSPKLTPTGQLSSLELLVAHPGAVEVVDRLRSDARFRMPVTPIAQLGSIPTGQRVRISGLTKGQEPGRFLLVRDETGQIEIATAQTRLCSINDRVEAVGVPTIHGTEWRLQDAFFRPVWSGANSANATVPEAGRLGPIRVAAEVLELTPEEAERGHPVHVTGVVTWSHPDAPFFFIQDSSGGVCIQRGRDSSKVRPPGRNVEIRGVTAMGDFAPVIVAAETTKIGDVILPAARQVSLEHALTGHEEAQWVEMRGYLRELARDGSWLRAAIATPAGDFTALLPPEEDLNDRIGAVVRLHGVCAASADENRKLTGIRLWVPSAGFVQVEEAAPADLFAVPGRSLASLGRFGTLPAQNRRVKVAGTVVHHAPGHAVQLQEGATTLQVLSRDLAPLAPGDRIEAVGFLGRLSGRVVLREAVYRKTGFAEPPRPRILADPARLAPAHDGHLTQVEGRLLDWARTGAGLRLTLQAEQAIIEAVLDHRPDEPVPVDWAPGSRLAVTGLYQLQFDDFGQPASFQLRLRSPADVAVLQHPTWLTARRVLAFTGGLAALTLGIIGWVFALRRRVRQQTELIRAQMQRESRLQEELQRASKLEAIGILAGGIAHDFNNLLTVVMGNLSLAMLDTGDDTEAATSLREARQAVLRARDLTQQLLTFAKGGAPVREAVNLPDIVREVTQFVLRGSAARCEFAIAPQLWPADVDKGQISQVVQNVVLNAVQAMPEGGTVRVSLRNDTVTANASPLLQSGRYLKLSVADTGTGIRTEDLPRIFDPYYTTKPQGSGLGLATVYSIVKRHLGHISVESQVGAGTTFHIWLPAAAPTTIPAAIPPVAASTPRKRTIRVLLMDDEEPIRRLCTLLLQRMGHAATAVSDGAAAIAEYQKARDAGRPFDLVILDLTIPGGLGGRQTLEQLRKLDPAVRAIVASGYSNDPVLANHREYGFSSKVAKPFEVDDLRAQIAAVLRGEET